MNYREQLYLLGLTKLLKSKVRTISYSDEKYVATIILSLPINIRIFNTSTFTCHVVPADVFILTHFNKISDTVFCDWIIGQKEKGL